MITDSIFETNTVRASDAKLNNYYSFFYSIRILMIELYNITYISEGSISTHT